MASYLECTARLAANDFMAHACTSGSSLVASQIALIVSRLGEPVPDCALAWFQSTYNIRYRCIWNAWVCYCIRSCFESVSITSV